MNAPSINTNDLIKAFTLLGERIGGYDDIEILIVGGMAGKLGGLFSPERTTIDCDVMIYDPETAFGQVEHEAFVVGKRLRLPPNWLNGDCNGFAHLLPPDWKSRRHLLGRFGLLWVFYVDRLDLIVLKALSGRDIDILDLQRIRVTSVESAFVRMRLYALRGTGRFDVAKVKEVELILDALET